VGEEKERARASLEPVFEFIKEFEIMNPFPLFVVEALPGCEKINGKDLGKSETQISFALVDEIRMGLSNEMIQKDERIVFMGMKGGIGLNWGKGEENGGQEGGKKERSRDQKIKRQTLIEGHDGFCVECEQDEQCLFEAC